LGPAEVPEIGDRMQQFLLPIIEKIKIETESWFAPIVSQSILHATKRLNDEKSRLEYLASVNKNFDTKEIEHLKAKLMNVTEHLQSSKPRIDGIRVIFTEEKNF